MDEYRPTFNPERDLSEPLAPALPTCDTCGKDKPPEQFVGDDCKDCDEAKRTKAESDRWADLRAQGKAAFVRYRACSIPFSRGQAVMMCLVCEALVVGEKKIKQHASRCRKK